MTLAALAAPGLPEIAGAGRVCPNDYRYAPDVFARTPEIETDTLYVVGGLYGNLEALAAVEALAATEPKPPAIVFNGDFHWFDAEHDWFDAIEAGTARHAALRGNVETEIARDQEIGAGCGCAYPPSVDEGTVRRSNEILDLLRHTARAEKRHTARLRDLPMHLVARVGETRVAIVHGDATALAGWSFAQDSLDHPTAPARLAAIQEAAAVDVFASTHTCLAALRQFALPRGMLTIINNGAAGMPNFSNDRRGLVSRIGLQAAPRTPLYGVRQGILHVDAMALDYDYQAFRRRFVTRWPLGSPAHLSYFDRIVGGPNYAVTQAQPCALSHIAR